MAYLYASSGLRLTLGPHFLFVHHDAYGDGILDEVCSTAWYAGAYKEGLSACKRLPLTDQISENIGYYLQEEEEEEGGGGEEVFLKLNSNNFDSCIIHDMCVCV